MRTYGLIGYPLSHSFSQHYFQEKFRKENITDASFSLFPIATIQQLPSLFTSHENLVGLAVTIPYKKEVISFLSSVNKVVTITGACNCIKKTDEGWMGFNTDVTGFKKSFTRHLKPQHTHALILGSGGAAAAVMYVLNKLKIKFTTVSRNPFAENISYQDLDESIMQSHKIIINCTPVGTFPASDEMPAIPYKYLTPQHYLFDMVYNPPITKFLCEGEKAGCTIQNGYEMLTIQAEENWRIWNE